MSSPKKHVVFDIVGTCVSYDVIDEAIDARLGPKLAAHSIKPALFGWAWIEAAEREYTYLSMQGATGASTWPASSSNACYCSTWPASWTRAPSRRPTTSRTSWPASSKCAPGPAQRSASPCWLLREAGLTVWAFTAGDAKRVGGYFEKAGIVLPADSLRSCDADGVGKPDPRAYR